MKFSCILIILKEDLVQDYYRDNQYENFSKSNYLNKFLRINFKDYENESLIKTVFSILIRLIEKLIRIVVFIVHAFIKFAFNDFFNRRNFGSVFENLARQKVVQLS